MILWEYRTARVENDTFLWQDGAAEPTPLAIDSGLRLFGSQGWELAGVIESERFGTTTRHTLVFKKPTES